MNPADQPTGPALPFRFDPASGGVAMQRGADKVLDDVRVLLATRIGERLMARDYGTRLPALVHEPNDEVLLDIARDQTQAALLRWEPRVAPAVVDVIAHPDEGRLDVLLGINHPAGSGTVVVPVNIR